MARAVLCTARRQGSAPASAGARYAQLDYACEYHVWVRLLCITSHTLQSRDDWLIIRREHTVPSSIGQSNLRVREESMYEPNFSTEVIDVKSS